MRIVCLLAWIAIPLCSAQESYKRLPELPQGLLLRPRTVAQAKPVVLAAPPAGCAMEMPRSESPAPAARMPEAEIKTRQDHSRVTNPDSPCPDKLLLLNR